MGQTVERVDEKVCVLEKAEQTQVHANGEHQTKLLLRRAAVLFHQAAAGVVQDRREEHQPHIHRLAPGIEEQAEQKQNRVPPNPGDEIINRQHGGQEQKQKTQTGKDHETPQRTRLIRNEQGYAAIEK